MTKLQSGSAVCRQSVWTWLSQRSNTKLCTDACEVLSFWQSSAHCIEHWVG